MGRRAKPLESGFIDLIEKREKQAKAKKKAAELEGKKPYKEYLADRAKSESQKIILEQTAPSYPLIVPFQGKLTPVVDPTGTWAMKTPPYFLSPQSMVLHCTAKPSPEVMAVIDFETFKLRAGVLHHAAALRFKDDDYMYSKSDYNQVEIYRDWAGVVEFIKSMCAELETKSHPDRAIRSERKKSEKEAKKQSEEMGIEHVPLVFDPLPELNREGKIYAHNGSNFDFVGLALHLGIDRNTGKWQEMVVDIDGKPKKITINAEITTHSGKSRITFSWGSGEGGACRVHLLDSYHLLSVPLAKLSDNNLVKGKTPEQFTDPLKWINRRKSAVTGKKFNVSLHDVRPYLVYAHKHPLEHFAGKLKPEAYEALERWLSIIEEPEYTCADVTILANALKRFARKFRTFAEPLRAVLGDAVVDSLKPFSFNTASTAGFALSVAYFYESRLEVNEFGVVQLKRSLQFQQKKGVYALIDPKSLGPKIIRGPELQVELEEGTPVQVHGIVKKGQKVIIEYPIWTSSFDNRFSRMAQNGSQTTVFQPIAKRMKEVDKNSAFPDAMANGCRKLVDFAECLTVFTKDDGGKEDRVIKGKGGPISCNALIGFEDPGYRQPNGTQSMLKHGIATCEMIKNEHGEEVPTWVVRGRQKILHMLQSRNGEFSCILVPTKNPDLSLIPGTPLRTPGRGLDSRLINARIIAPTLMLLRGEYLAAYAAHETVDDEAMVVFLCEDTGVKGPNQYRPRSQHGPILGISVDKHGIPFGKPHMPHKKFFDMMFHERLSEKKKAKDAFDKGDLVSADRYAADSEMTKLIMNGGGYGTYAQSKRPEVDFNLASIEECVDVIGSLVGLDPAWRGMAECVKKLCPDMDLKRVVGKKSEEGGGDIIEEVVGWTTLNQAIAAFSEEYDAAIEAGVAYRVTAKKQQWISAMRDLFTEWADNQITTFTTMPYKSPEIGDDGKRVMQTRGVLTAAEETISHAIRPYASAVVAKAAINLHEGQLAIHRSPFGLCYSDTDSLHAETGVIKPVTNPKAVEYIASVYEKAYSETMEDAQVALQRLMNDGKADTDTIFKDILKIYGLDVGKDLGQWNLEEHFYTKGLASPALEGQQYSSQTTYYFAPKVYIDLDADNRVARTKVRSVPKLNPTHPAVFEGHLVGVPTLADRRGLDQEKFRHVKLDNARRMPFGKKKVAVESMFSNPRRIYKDEGFSQPFDLSMPAALEARIMKGEAIRPETMSSAIMSQIGLDENLERVKGLQEAYLEYRAKARIAGMSFDSVVAKVKEEENYYRDIIIEQQLSDEYVYDPDFNGPVIAFSEEQEYPDYIKEALDDHQAMLQAHKDGKGEDPGDFLPF